MLQGIATLTLWTEDMAEAKRWYAELLGSEVYFERPGPDGKPAYAEFRIGDYQTELGLLDRRFAPSGMATETGGVIAYWNVESVKATFDRLLSMGGTELEPVTEFGQGFTRAAVADPFGNVLGLMDNPHYREIRTRIGEVELPDVRPDMG